MTGHAIKIILEILSQAKMCLGLKVDA